MSSQTMRIPRPTLTQWIFIGMGIGLMIGWVWPDIGTAMRPLSQIFLRLIRSIIAPLIFATLVVGIAGHGNLKQVGRMGVKALIYFEIVTTIALVIGLAVVNVMRPGVGVNLQTTEPAAGIAAKPQTFSDVLVHIVPQNFIQAAAEGEVLQIVVVTLIFSFALAMIPAQKKAFLVSFCDSLAETMFKFTGNVMKYAHIGVGELLLSGGLAAARELVRARHGPAVPRLL